MPASAGLQACGTLRARCGMRHEAVKLSLAPGPHRFTAEVESREGIKRTISRDIFVRGLPAHRPTRLKLLTIAPAYQQSRIPVIEFAERDAHLFGRRRPGRRLRGLAPQHGVDARDQLARIEGLGEVVVGAHLEPDDAVGLLAPRRQHQDGRRLVPAGPEFAAEDEPVIAGHHQIEDDEIDGVGLEKAAHLPAVGGSGNAQPVLLEIARDELADLAVVVDDQDVVDMVHRPMS